MFRRPLFLGLAALFALAACQQPPAEPPVPGEMDRTGTVLKMVNGKPVTQDMLDAMIAQLPEQLRAQLEATGQMSQMAEQLVIQEILYQKAIEAGLHKDPEVQRALAIVERSTLADQMIRREVDKRITEEAIQKWYDDHAVQFARPQVKLAHIMVQTEDEAKAIKAQLDAGADFAALAREKSQDPRTKNDGGEIGWVRAKDIGPLGAAIEGAEKGTIAGPVSSGRAWHILKVLDTRDKTPLEEVRDQIIDQLKNELADEYIKEVKESATIVDGAGGAAATPEPGSGGAAPQPDAAGDPPANTPAGGGEDGQ